MKTSYRERDYTYGAVMLKLRTAIGLTQSELANRLGVSRITVVKWETGSSYPRAEHLKDVIVLAVKVQAFAPRQEAEEIRALWKAARQKMPLDDHWLSALLDQRDGLEEGSSVGARLCPRPANPLIPTPTAGVDRTGASPIRPTPLRNLPLQGEPDRSEPYPAHAPTDSQIPTPESTAPTQTRPENFPHCRDEIGASHDSHAPLSETDKTRGRHKRRPGILTALVVLLLIGSMGTLFFLARDGALTHTNETATVQAYPKYLSENGTLAFFDPLGQKGSNNWTENSNDAGGSCRFTGGAYHVSQQPNGLFSPCYSHGIFSNFAFEVQLTIAQGDCGGITFRDNENGKYYYFNICENRTYDVSKYVDNVGTTLYFDSSSAIHTGLGHQNKIAVVSNGSLTTFYVNEQQIGQEQDSSYISGRIALIASPYHSGGHATDVAYSNARLWTV